MKVPKTTTLDLICPSLPPLLLQSAQGLIAQLPLSHPPQTLALASRKHPKPHRFI